VPHDRRKTPAIAAARVPRVMVASRAAHVCPSPPSSVHPASWALFTTQLDVARNGGTLVGGAFRQSVAVVVAEMRAAAESWDAIYAALGGAVGEGSRGEVHYSPNDTHINHGAALVAHMHAWADCARLEELETEGQ
jgi:hypothetical protein